MQVDKKQPKRRIRQNVWGNWYGYEGSRRVIAFANLPEASQETAANEWLHATESPDIADGGETDESNND